MKKQCISDTLLDLREIMRFKRIEKLVGSFKFKLQLSKGGVSETFSSGFSIT